VLSQDVNERETSRLMMYANRKNVSGKYRAHILKKKKNPPA